MKKLVILIVLFSLSFMLVSCFDKSTVYPDMVEYSETEILEAAKDKYNINSFLYTSYRVDKNERASTEFNYNNYSCNGIFSNLKNPDNLKKALTSFAGKNGGRQVQSHYSLFACYLALGIDNNNKPKFIYYNTNINKNEQIVDTIGSSDYPYELSPLKINTKFMDEIKWNSLRVNFKEQYYDKISIKGLLYCFEKPTIITSLHSTKGLYLVQFYEENDKTVFDIFRVTLRDDFRIDNLNQYITSQELIYSTSNNYECYYTEYGVDYNDFFDINFTVEQSTEADCFDLISGTITPKDVGKEVVHYSFTFKVTYLINNNGKVTETSDIRGKSELINNRYGLLIDKIEGYDHKYSTKVSLVTFSIIYKRK